MKDYQIAPSILSADFAHLYRDTQAVIDAGADLIHFDVMDNHFVPNLTMGPMVCQALINAGIQAPIDAHLMVKPVDSMIHAFIDAGASMISFHPEASCHVHRSVRIIQERNCRAGLALNPATPLCVLDHILDELDFILIMSVNPGFGGQSFIPATLEKIKALRQRIEATGRRIPIQVDGGVSVKNIAEIAKAGAQIFVAGTAIFAAQDYHRAIADMRDQLKIQ